jgi:hypothetical protein
MGRLGINIVMIHRRAPPVEVLREGNASEMRLDPASVIPTVDEISVAENGPVPV